MLSLDRTGAEHMLGIHHQLLLPVLDLIRMHLELIGEIGQGYALLGLRPTTPKSALQPVANPPCWAPKTAVSST